MVMETMGFLERLALLKGPTGLSSTQTLILIILAHHQNRNAHSWPSMTSLAESTKLTDKTLRRNLRELEAAGWLEVSTGGARSTNRFVINDERLTACDPTTGQMTPPVKSPPVRRPRADPALCPVTPGQMAVAAPVVRQAESKKKAKQSQLEPAEAWEEVCAAGRRRRFPVYGELGFTGRESRITNRLTCAFCY